MATHAVALGCASRSETLVSSPWSPITTALSEKGNLNLHENPRLSYGYEALTVHGAEKCMPQFPIRDSRSVPGRLCAHPRPAGARGPQGSRTGPLGRALGRGPWAGLSDGAPGQGLRSCWCIGTPRRHGGVRARGRSGPVRGGTAKIPPPARISALRARGEWPRHARTAAVTTVEEPRRCQGQEHSVANATAAAVGAE